MGDVIEKILYSIYSIFHNGQIIIDFPIEKIVHVYLPFTLPLISFFNSIINIDRPNFRKLDSN